MKLLNSKVKSKIENFVRSNYERINVIPGKCRYNFNCHMNAVHDAMEADNHEIAMTIYIDDGWPIIHFISIHNGYYIDNTLGQWCKYYEYYLVKIVKREEFHNVNKIFDSYRETLSHKLTWYERLLSDYRS
jgi:hypothetical protein